MPETERVLDRIPEFDDKSRNFQIRGILEATNIPDKAPVSKRWNVGPILDQGKEGACVGFGLTHRLMSEPVMNKGLDAGFAFSLYHEAQTLDDEPGEGYSGTSVLAGVKAAQARGYVGAYHWVGAGSGKVIADIMSVLSYIGPIVFGLNWAESMFEPRPSGLLEVDTTRISGGHCIQAAALLLEMVLPGEAAAYDLIGFTNSWGPDWGKGGWCYMKVEDVETLMGMQGEGLVITQENFVLQPAKGA